MEETGVGLDAMLKAVEAQGFTVLNAPGVVKVEQDGPPAYNWAPWKARNEAKQATLDGFARDLGERTGNDSNRFAIDGDRMVLVAKDAEGNVRTFDLQIRSWNFKHAYVHGQGCPCHPVELSIDAEVGAG